MEYITFLRQFRIGGFAIFDTTLGYIGILLLSPLLTKLFAKLGIFIPWQAWLWFMLPISVLFHLLFDQQTPLIKALSQAPGFLIVNTVLVFMIFMGVRNCRQTR